MNIQELKDRLTLCAESNTFCKISFRYEYSEKNLLPIAVGNECFICAEESDFNLDGFVIHRISDIDTLKTSENGFAEKAMKSGALREMNAPPLELDTFASVLCSLRQISTVVMIEKNDKISGIAEFIMGKIVNAGPLGCLICRINISGEWSRVPDAINAEEIKCISFGKKSQELYSKLLPYCPIK